jgi:hypothetical protein
MSAQQIKLNIHTLVNSIEDESILDACYEVLASVVKIATKQRNSRVSKEEVMPQSMPFIEENNKISASVIAKNGQEEALDEDAEKVIPHDLSLVFLANALFKGSEPLPEVGEIAFDKAFKKSLKKEPSLPNRL